MIPNWAVQELAERLNGSKAQGKIVQEYAERYGVSTATVYRKLMKEEGRKGTIRITEEERAAAMLVSGYLQIVRTKKGIAPSTETAISELTLMGKLPGKGRIQSLESRIQNPELGAGEERVQSSESRVQSPELGAESGEVRSQKAKAKGQISRQRMDAVMGAMGLTKRHMSAPKPYIRLRATAPNEWHQIDFTPAGMFYLENGWIAINPEFKKDQTMPKGRTPVKIGMCVDMFSGCVYAQAYEAAGESAELALRTMYDAWRDKGDIYLPVHGAPWNVYSDQGPGLKSGPVQALLDNLFVTWKGHQARRPTATGKVERAIKNVGPWETLIRGRQAFGYRFSLKEFNSWLHNFCVNENGRRHVDFKDQTRAEVWSANIKDEDIRKIPEWLDFVALSAAEVGMRRVSQECSIQWDSKKYFLGDARRAVNYIGARVQVYRMGDGQLYAKSGGEVFGPLTDRIPTNKMGIDFKQAPLSQSERMLRDAVSAAEGVGMKAKDMPFLRNDKAEAYVPRTGRTLKAKQGRVQMKGAEPEWFNNEWAAIEYLVAHFGGLGDIPDWAQEKVRGMVHAEFEADGRAATAYLRSVGELVERLRQAAGEEGLTEPAGDGVVREFLESLRS